MNDDISLTLIHPLILGKIKPYQNLSLIISGVLLLLAFILSVFDNHILSSVTGYLVVLCVLFIILFILLSLPFFFKKLEIAMITNEIISIDIDHKPTEFNIKDVKFLLNLDSKFLMVNELLTAETVRSLSTWGNYIVVPSHSSMKDIYVQFIPDEDLLKILPQIKIETNKRRSILMNDTDDMLKSFMGLLWGAS